MNKEMLSNKLQKRKEELLKEVKELGEKDGGIIVRKE